MGWRPSVGGRRTKGRGAQRAGFMLSNFSSILRREGGGGYNQSMLFVVLISLRAHCMLARNSQLMASLGQARNVLGQGRDLVARQVQAPQAA